MTGLEYNENTLAPKLWEQGYFHLRVTGLRRRSNEPRV